MDIQEGKMYYFYDDRATDDVCKAHVLKVLPHPERKDDRLVVYRWYGKHKQHWWYGVTSISQQDLWAEYCAKVIAHRKERRKECNDGVNPFPGKATADEILETMNRFSKILKCEED